MPDKGKIGRLRGSGRVGIRDVARDAGVSVATVSRTLANDGYPVSEESRNKVLRSVAKLGFVPNDLARSLSQDRTNTIGIIVPNVVNLYYAHLVMGAEEVAAENGFSTIFCNTNSSAEKLEFYVRVLLQKRVDGIILCGSAPDLERNPARAALKDLPFIAIGRNDKLGCPSVHADNFKAGYEATQHLIELGHKKLAFLSGPQQWADGSDRIKGFRACVAEHGIPATDAILSHGPLTEQNAYERTRDLGRNRVTAILGGNDRVAIGAMAALSDLGLSVPDDVAVIGFDNITTATFVRPALTTMDIPAQTMGAEAMRLILKLQNGEHVPSRTIFDAPLLVRGSTARSSAIKEHMRSQA
jgi:DNA-binding LacI/PurR family transcriptional regulator